MSSVSIALSPAPYHLFAYSTLFGSQMYRFFIYDVAAFRTLDRPSFYRLYGNISLQFLGIQALCPLILGLTSPFPIKDRRYALTVTAPLVTMMVIGALNYLWNGTAIQSIVAKHQLQEDAWNQDARKVPGFGTRCELRDVVMNKKLFVAVGVADLIAGFGTLIGSFATVIYGFTFAQRMK